VLLTESVQRGLEGTSEIRGYWVTV
jgi:hypothetical protein